MAAVARGRGVAPACVLLLDPTYGEYAHVCERVVGCTVEHLTLDRRDGFRVDLDHLAARLKAWTWSCWSTPTTPAAATHRDVVVCKSLSKAYALSGVRAGYLVGHPDVVAELRPLTPPWAVGLPAQLAAVHALAATEYYDSRYAATHTLRGQLAAGLAALDPAGQVLTSVANWVLWFPGPDVPSPAEIARHARARGVHLRTFGAGSPCADALRIAVKDGGSQERVLATIAEAIGSGR